MRHCLFAFALAALPLGARAESFTATSRITAVTLYPQGAEVTRVVSLDLPAGSHQLRIGDLPQGIDPGLIRLNAETTSLGAFVLQQAGMAPGAEVPFPELEAAVSAAEAARDAAELELARLDAQIGAITARGDFLRRSEAEVTTQAPADLAAMAQMIGAEVLAAEQAALELRAGRPALERALDKASAKLDQARAAEEARRAAQADKALLSVDLEQRQAGKAEITLRHYVSEARWQPVYDAHLSRKPAPKLVLNRGALVSQSSGEDWQGVALTLSTAQPAAQAAPSELWPDLRRAEKPEPPMVGASVADAVAEVMMEPVAAAPARGMEMQMMGDIAVYQAPGAVTVASGVEDLRVALSELSLTPEVEARAVPRRDSTAFVVAKAEALPELLLPGMVYLFRDGQLVGGQDIGTVAAGDKLELPFGPIEGLSLTRDMPRNSEGDAGVFSSDTARKEAAVLKIENLTNEAWPVHLLDQVPYSEQDDLKITYTATETPDEIDPEGQRGLLGWHFELEPGAVQDIGLEVEMRWPAGLELR
ncbi:MAG TPA: DUF4139 domain-containing protein [Gemmobacter sp.]|nr:DUF4139 domain-containing protein [Gemmobacter sp.]